jgi:hypothetical protein
MQDPRDLAECKVCEGTGRVGEVRCPFGDPDCVSCDYPCSPGETCLTCEGAGELTQAGYVDSLKEKEI